MPVNPTETMLRAALDRIAEVEERVRQLEKAKGDTPETTVAIPGFNRMVVPGLTPRQREVLGVMMRRRVATFHALSAALWPDRSQCRTGLWQHVVEIRRKLAPMGISVQTMKGEGYFIPSDDKRRLVEICTAGV